jgi:hypothetical protein
MPPKLHHINEYLAGRLLRDAKLYAIGAGTNYPPHADRPRAVRRPRLIAKQP